MNTKNLPYRKGVNAYVIDSQNNFLLVQKKSYGENQWDVSGGGLEEGESMEIGILRELEEELGTHKFKILAKSSKIDKYEWPKEARENGYRKHGKWWRGQKKYQFLVKFIGSKNELKAQKEEIRLIKWVPYEQLEDTLYSGGLSRELNLGALLQDILAPLL
ncbi:NUDIX domain-containing protein [Patescibacteria group bacterium]|nr:NUDIX domain-containing protein [Patescibacteria group bacterium]